MILHSDSVILEVLYILWIVEKSPDIRGRGDDECKYVEVYPAFRESKRRKSWL